MTENAQPQHGWIPIVGGCAGTSTFYVTPTTEYLMVAKSEYDALKAENERLQKRIAELEAQLAQEAP